MSPTIAERRRLAVLAAVALAAAGWLVGGRAVAVVAGDRRAGRRDALLRARRHRFRAALAASAPAVARALADALSAGHAVRGALDVVAASVPGAAGHELGRPPARCGSARGPRRCSSACAAAPARPPGTRWSPGILLQRDAGGDLPGLLRDLADALEAAARQDRDAIAATAQARFTARIVLALPVGAAVLAELAQPGLLAGLLTNPVCAWLTCLALAAPDRRRRRRRAASPGTWSGERSSPSRAVGTPHGGAGGA